MSLSKEKTEEIIKKIEEALKRKTTTLNLKCSVCTHNNFSVVSGFTHDFLSDNIGGNIVMGGVFLPSVPLVCSNCGNTFFFNTKILGLNDDLKTEDKKEGKK